MLRAERLSEGGLVSGLGVEGSRAQEGTQRVCGAQSTSWRGERVVPGAQGGLGPRTQEGTALVWTGSRGDGQSLPSRACLLRERTGAPFLTRFILFLQQSRRAEGGWAGSGW